MKQFEVCTEEKIARVYIVTAETADDARAKFIDGTYDKEMPGECIDCEVVDVFEVEATA